MIYQLYAIFFFITLIFVFVGYFAEADVLKVVGYGLIFVLGVMLFQPSFFGNVEKCDYLGNYSNNQYIYGANYTGYHVDYDYDFNPSEDGVRLFHVYENPTYTEICQEIQNRTIGFWLSLLGLLGFVTVFTDRKNQKMFMEDHD